MQIEEYIQKASDIIQNNDVINAEILYNEIVASYSDKIKELENGTSVLRYKENQVWQLNFDEEKEYLHVDIDYISDLKIVLSKLIEYARENHLLDNSYENSAVSKINNITISESKIEKSNICINSEDSHKKKNFKSIIEIVGFIAGIATIIATIISFLTYFNAY